LRLLAIDRKHNIGGSIVISHKSLVFVLTKHKDMAMATALKRRCKQENKLMAAPKSRPEIVKIAYCKRLIFNIVNINFRGDFLRDFSLCKEMKNVIG
jgi:hypothetical protein